MAEFERPRAKALSDAELSRALQTFPSDANGVELAGKLMSEQHKLREQDLQELQAWLELLKARDDQQSRQILADSMADLSPQQTLEIAPEPQEPPVLTSQLQIITRRGKVASRLRISQARRLATVSILIAAASTLVLEWLNISNLSALAAIACGLGLAFLISVPLKRHLLHPMLRAAAVFGGRGVYVFAVLALGATSVFFTTAFLGHSELAGVAKVGPYSAVVVVMVSASMLLVQLVPVRFGSAIIALASASAVGLLVSQTFEFTAVEGLEAGWHWGAAGVAVVATLILLVASPHTPVEMKTVSWLLPLTLLTTGLLVVAVPYSSEFALVVVIFALMLGLGFSGRDLAGGWLGRATGLAPLSGLIFSPLADPIGGVVLSILSASLVMLLLDQLFRSSPLHIASLQTSYGFYGAAPITGWLALALSAISGTSLVTSALPEFLNHLEWSLVGGVIIGLLFGFIRIPIIRRQDREIRNIDSASGNIENLLGL